MNRFHTLACAALCTLALACSASTPESESESESDPELFETDTEGPLPEVCEIIQSGVPQTDCGTYRTGDHEGCWGETGDRPSDGNEGDTGGSDSGGPDCDQFEQDNAATLACILQAAADGTEFSFTHDDRSFVWNEDTYHFIVSEELMWTRSTSEFGDCNESVYEAVDLSACDAWECVYDALEYPPNVASCTRYYEQC